MRLRGASFVICAVCSLVACSGQSKHAATGDAARADSAPDQVVESGTRVDSPVETPNSDAAWLNAVDDGIGAIDAPQAEAGHQVGDTSEVGTDLPILQAVDVASDMPAIIMVEAGAGDSPVDGPAPDGDASTPIDAAHPADADLKLDAPVGGDIAPDAAARRIISVPLAGSDFVVDRALGRLYVSVNGAADSYANTIAVVDVASGEVLSSIPVGSNPRSLALSDDASTLWVGVDGALAIRSVDLTSTPPTLGRLHTLPTTVSSVQAPVTAGAMVALPGSRTSVMAILLGTGLDAVAVLDDGVARPTIDSFPSAVPTHFAAASSALVFGFDNSNTGFSFIVLTLSATGVTAKSFSDLVQGFGNQIIYQANRVYARGGEIIDVSDPAKPTALQKLSWQGALANGAAGRLVMLGTNSTSTTYSTGRPAQILVLDTSTLQPLASASFPTDVAAFNPIAFSIGKLLYAGDDAVVFSYSGLDITTDQYVSGLTIFHDPVLRAANK